MVVGIKPECNIYIKLKKKMSATLAMHKLVNAINFALLVEVDLEVKEGVVALGKSGEVVGIVEEGRAREGREGRGER